jgi:hypothetical protein
VLVVVLTDVVLTDVVLAVAMVVWLAEVELVSGYVLVLELDSAMVVWLDPWSSDDVLARQLLEIVSVVSLDERADLLSVRQLDDALVGIG